MREREEMLEELPDHLRTKVVNLSARPRKQQFRKVLRAVLARREWTSRELALLFGRASVSKLLYDHLSPMVEEGLIERTIPETPTDPRQAYRATTQSLGPLFENNEETEEPGEEPE